MAPILLRGFSMERQILMRFTVNYYRLTLPMHWRGR